MGHQSKSYSARIYRYLPGIAHDYVIELRPQTGTWAPFVAGIPFAEKVRVNPDLSYGPQGLIPAMGMLFASGESQSDDGKWLLLYAPNEATSAQSYFIFCDQVPSKLMFGVHNGRPQYIVDRLQ